MSRKFREKKSFNQKIWFAFRKLMKEWGSIIRGHFASWPDEIKADEFRELKLTISTLNEVY